MLWTTFLAATLACAGKANATYPASPSAGQPNARERIHLSLSLSFLARVYAHGDDDDDDDPAYVDACEYIHLPVTGRSLKA